LRLQRYEFDAGTPSLDARREAADRLARKVIEAVAYQLARIDARQAIQLYRSVEPPDSPPDAWLTFIRQEHVHALLLEGARSAVASGNDATRVARALLALGEPAAALDALRQAPVSPWNWALRCHAEAERVMGPSKIGDVERTTGILENLDVERGPLYAYDCRARLGSRASVPALREAMAHMPPWPRLVARWLLGETSEETLLRAGESMGRTARPSEVRYYAGLGHLLRGTIEDNELARVRFREAVQSSDPGHASTSLEHDLALIELGRLELPRERPEPQERR